MEGFLKLSTQVTVTILCVDSSDHITGKTGLAAGLTIYASKAGAAPAAITPTTVELDATNVKGVYSLVLTTTHTNTLGELQLHITGTGMDPADVKWQVSTYLPGEAATLQTDQAVNTTKVGGTTQTARDLGASVLLSSGTGTGQLSLSSGLVTLAAVTHTGARIPNVTLADTVTTYTGNTVQTGDGFARIGAAGVSLSAIPDLAGVTTLLARLSAARAGYLDNVNNAALLTTVAQTGDVYPLVDTEVAAIKAKTDNLPASPAAVGSAMTLTAGERTAIADATRTRQLSEGYAVDGVAPTFEQSLFMIMQGILEFGIAGTVLTTRKLDKGTAAMTHTLNDAVSPTSRTRAT